MIKNILYILFIILLIDFIIYMTCNYNFHKIYYPQFYEPIINKINNSLNLNVSIVCLCRDISSVFYNSKIQIDNIVSRFKNHRIIIYENDSKDNSRELLCKWSKQNNKVILLRCNILAECSKDCITNVNSAYNSKHNDRIPRMTKYRNTALDHIKRENKNGSFKTDVVIVYDFDIQGNLNMSEFDNIFSKYGQWDAIFANGRMPFPPFDLNTKCYDALAFREKWTISRNLVSRIIRMNYLIDYSNDFIPVASAFNGLGVYTYKSIENAKYNTFEDPYNCEHVGLHYNMHKNGFNKLFINKKLTLYTGKQGPSNYFKPILKVIQNQNNSSVVF